MGCAEPSVVQATLEAWTAEKVNPMHPARGRIFRRPRQTYRHDYPWGWQWRDADMTGRPCGQKAQFASKGYFAKPRHRRGRQEGDGLGTWYAELIGERWFEGKIQLNTAWPPLLEAAEQVLELDEDQRPRTIVRIDSGGGSLGEINGLLGRAYPVQAKDYSGVRAKTLAESVREWIPDPADRSRQRGWVTLPADRYGRPVRRVAVRCRKKNGQGGYGIMISTLSPKQGLLWAGG